MIELLMSGGGFIPTKITNGLVFRTSKEASLYQEISEPSTTQNIFNTWPRIDGNTYITAEEPKTGSANNWFYDEAQKSFVQPDNTSTQQSIISPVKLSSFVLDVTLRSTNSDDDVIGVVAAADHINGSCVAVYAVVHAGGGGGSRFSLRFADVGVTNSGTQIVGNNIIASHANSGGGNGWSGKTIRLRVERAGNVISAKCSNWDSNALLDESELVLNLSELGGNGQILTNPSRYGFTTFSQAASTYLNIDLQSSQLAPDNLVYASDSNQKWSFDGATWVLQQDTAYETFNLFDRVFNDLTKETFTVETTTLQHLRNDGIPYGTYDVSVQPYTIHTFPISGLLANYPYEEVLGVTALLDDVNTVSTLGANNISATVGTTDASTYAMLSTTPTTDPVTGIKETTLGFRKINFMMPDLITANVFGSDDERELYRIQNAPASPQQIFDTWPRTQNLTFFEDPATATGDAAAWTFDSQNNTFIQPINSLSAQSILSPVKVSNYTLETTLASSDPDGDLIGIVAASDYINGELLSLVFICQTGGRNHMPGFSATFIDSTTTVANHDLNAETIVGNNFLVQDPIETTAGNTNPDWGWWYRQVKIKVERTGSTVTAVISDWNGASYDEASRLTVDLSTLPRNGSLLAQPSRYGFFSHSQGDSKYLNIQFSSIDLGDDSVLYSLESNTKQSFNGSTWNTTAGVIGDFAGYDLVFNDRTKTFYNVGTSLTVDREFGISSGNATTSVPQNATTSVTIASIIGQYTFEATMNLIAVSNATGVSASINGTNIDITTTTGNGSFDIYIESDSYTDQFTKQITKTVAVRKVNVTVV